MSGSLRRPRSDTSTLGDYRGAVLGGGAKEGLGETLAGSRRVVLGDRSTAHDFCGRHLLRFFRERGRGRKCRPHQNAFPAETFAGKYRTGDFGGEAQKWRRRQCVRHASSQELLKDLRIRAASGMTAPRPPRLCRCDSFHHVPMVALRDGIMLSLHDEQRCRTRGNCGSCCIRRRCASYVRCLRWWDTTRRSKHEQAVRDPPGPGLWIHGG
jgi:hypothetical protein